MECSRFKVVNSYDNVVVKIMISRLLDFYVYSSLPFANTEK